MASAFTSRSKAPQSAAQKREHRLAWKPNSARAKMNQSSPVVVVFRSEARQAELAAREAANASATA